MADFKIQLLDLKKTNTPRVQVTTWVVGARVAEDGAVAWRRGEDDRDRVKKAARTSLKALEAHGGGVLLVRDAGDLCEDAWETAALDALCDRRVS